MKNKHENDWKTICRVVPYLWPKTLWVKYRVIFSFLTLILAKLVAVSSPFFYREVVDNLAKTENVSIWIFTIGISSLVIAYGLSHFLRVSFEELSNFLFARVGQRALRILAIKTITHIHELSLNYHITRKTGALSRVIERGVKGIELLLKLLLFNMAPLVLELILISIILLVVFDFWYLFIISISVILYVVFTAFVTEWRVKIRKQMNDTDKEANQKAIDGLLNFETVKYFNAEQREIERYDQSMKAFEQASVKTVYSLSFLNLGQSILINTGLILSLLLALYDVQNGKLTVGDFVMINYYILQVMLPLEFLGYMYREIRQALVDMSEMFHLLEQPKEIVDKPDAKELQIQQGKIEFDNITFGYDSNRIILKNLSFTVKEKETVAIVGSSGSGKSTIGRLLFRFYDVLSGNIRIDEQDICDITQKSLHESVGVIPQDTVLFNDTIFYNIAYGRPEVTKEQIEQAAKAAQIHDFILKLPQGYETIVGERGLKLSGGEKQRVGIARTLLKNPHILLLDEATSALDTETEKDIQTSLYEMTKGRTVIMIAHRLSTIVNADQIIVLEEGKIIEKGTHKQLLSYNRKYGKMWKKQLSSN